MNVINNYYPETKKPFSLFRNLNQTDKLTFTPTNNVQRLKIEKMGSYLNQLTLSCEIDCTNQLNNFPNAGAYVFDRIRLVDNDFNIIQTITPSSYIKRLYELQQVLYDMINNVIKIDNEIDPVPTNPPFTKPTKFLLPLFFFFSNGIESAIDIRGDKNLYIEFVMGSTYDITKCTLSLIQDVEQIKNNLVYEQPMATRDILDNLVETYTVPAGQNSKTITITCAQPMTAISLLVYQSIAQNQFNSIINVTISIENEVVFTGVPGALVDLFSNVQQKTRLFLNYLTVYKFDRTYAYYDVNYDAMNLLNPSISYPITVKVDLENLQTTAERTIVLTQEYIKNITLNKDGSIDQKYYSQMLPIGFNTRGNQ